MKSRRVRACVPTARWKFSMPVCFCSGVRYVDMENSLSSRVGGDLAVRLSVGRDVRPVTPAPRVEELHQAVEAEPAAAARGCQSQESQHFNQVLVDEQVMPFR